MLPDFERANCIGVFWRYPETGFFGELLIDVEEDPALLGVLVGILLETRRQEI